ncbi:hypothetical protein D3C73_1476000 [compost metagenome]
MIVGSNRVTHKLRVRRMPDRHKDAVSLHEFLLIGFIIPYFQAFHYAGLIRFNR